jgi:hypothetical protein
MRSRVQVPFARESLLCPQIIAVVTRGKLNSACDPAMALVEVMGQFESHEDFDLSPGRLIFTPAPAILLDAGSLTVFE